MTRVNKTKRLNAKMLKCLKSELKMKLISLFEQLFDKLADII